MRTLGIDLAAQPANTAACLIEWGIVGAEVRWLRKGAECSDDAMLEWMGQADEVGIDAPFGWPETLVELLPEYLISGAWPVAPRLDGGRLYYDGLRYRETDRSVQRLLEGQGKGTLWPLSVSSDSIAVVAWRCAHLLHRHAESTGHHVDRIGGSTHVFETYPAAALASWGIDRKGYKTRTAAGRGKARAARELILDRVNDAREGWLNLELTQGAREALVASDHALDAFISALVARAAAQKHTTLPRPEQRSQAEREGWIHVPRPEALEALGPPSA